MKILNNQMMLLIKQLMDSQHQKKILEQKKLKIKNNPYNKIYNI